MSIGKASLSLLRTCRSALLAVTLAGMSLSAAAASINYEGLWWAAPAGSESGWGINFAHQGDIIFATWFTYDLTGKGLWLTMTAPKGAANTYGGTLYTTTGPAFNAVPFVPAQVALKAVGSGTLTFSDASNGSFTYTVNGIAQTKAITRQVFGQLPNCGTATGSLAAATNYQDLWWAAPAGSESGWGVNFTQQGDTIFATWFTYDVDHTPLWLSVTATKTAPGAYSGTLYRTTGPAFNAVPFNPANVVLSAVGSASLSFSDGNHASFAYTVNGSAQTKMITRQIFVAPGTVCSPAAMAASKVQITAIDHSTADPFTLLTVTGTGFDPTLAISVRFIPKDPTQTISIPVIAASTAAVQVIVPTLFDSATHSFVSGAVEVQVAQASGSGFVLSNSFSGLNINALPAAPPGATPGQMTAALLQAMLNVSAAVQAAASGDPSLSGVGAGLPGFNANTNTIAAAIATIISNPAGTGSLALNDGVLVTLDALALGNMDQLAQAIIAYLVQHGQIPPPMASATTRFPAKASSACPTSNPAAAGYDSNLCALQKFLQNTPADAQPTKLAVDTATANIFLGFIGAAPVTSPTLAVVYGAVLTPQVAAYAVDHKAATVAEIATGAASGLINISVASNPAFKNSGILLPTIKDLLLVSTPVVAAFPPLNPVPPSNCVTVNDGPGNTYVSCPGGVTVVAPTLPATAEVYKGTQTRTKTYYPNPNCTWNAAPPSTVTPQSIEVDVDGHLLIPGTYPATLTLGPATETTQYPSQTCTNPDGSQTTVPGQTIVNAKPGGTESIEVASDGKTLVVTMTRFNESCTGVVSTTIAQAPGTGIVSVTYLARQHCLDTSSGAAYDKVEQANLIRQ